MDRRTNPGAWLFRARLETALMETRRPGGDKGSADGFACKTSATETEFMPRSAFHAYSARSGGSGRCARRLARAFCRRQQTRRSNYAVTIRRSFQNGNPRHRPCHRGKLSDTDSAPSTTALPAAYGDTTPDPPSGAPGRSRRSRRSRTRCVARTDPHGCPPRHRPGRWSGRYRRAMERGSRTCGRTPRSPPGCRS